MLYCKLSVTFTEGSAVAYIPVIDHRTLTLTLTLARGHSKQSTGRAS